MACKILVEFIGMACLAGMVVAMAQYLGFAWLYDCDCVSPILPTLGSKFKVEGKMKM